MFSPGCLPLLIGSLPLLSHKEAVELILSTTPEIPLWPQLPKLKGEGMVRQFLSGFPGLVDDNSKYWIDTRQTDFESEMTDFYQDYLDIEENNDLLHDSRFKLGGDTAGGFAALTSSLDELHHSCITLKGQITGPVTTGLGVKDHNKRGIFYDENLRDILIKHLSLKARWQVVELKKYTDKNSPIVFIDEPGIVSFGSSSFLGISREMVSDAVGEVISVIKKAGGLAGIHICANGDWEPVLSSDADIISFDAYFYFDNFILYKTMLAEYIKRGGILAWGIIPTGNPDILEAIKLPELYDKWQAQLDHICQLGFTREQILSQTFIAPSCGTGSLSTAHALKVLRLTAELSKMVRTH